MITLWIESQLPLYVSLSGKREMEYMQTGQVDLDYKRSQIVTQLEKILKHPEGSQKSKSLARNILDDIGIDYV